MKQLICVGIGGCIGASIRYIITKQATNLFNFNIPLGTLISKCFLSLGGVILATSLCKVIL